VPSLRPIVILKKWLSQGSRAAADRLTTPVLNEWLNFPRI
jgi:hypothetical protein